MGYFPNGTAGETYEAQYCRHCVHQKLDDGGCAVWLLHMLHNYEECNKPDSFLHTLIPRAKDGYNEQCLMFHPADPTRCRETAEMFND